VGNSGLGRACPCLIRLSLPSVADLDSRLAAVAAAILPGVEPQVADPVRGHDVLAAVAVPVRDPGEGVGVPPVADLDSRLAATRRPPGGTWVRTTSKGNAAGAGSAWAAARAARNWVVITTDTLQHGTDTAAWWLRCQPPWHRWCQEPGIGAVFPGTGQPIPVQGRWLASVVRGHFAYYAVPGNTDAVAAFRTQATRHWYKALRRRSQRPRVNWERMNRHATRWLPPARVMHPFPDARFDARTRGRSPVR